jgi:hypothetical protein
MRFLWITRISPDMTILPLSLYVWYAIMEYIGVEQLMHVRVRSLVGGDAEMLATFTVVGSYWVVLGEDG